VAHLRTVFVDNPTNDGAALAVTHRARVEPDANVCSRRVPVTHPFAALVFHMRGRSRVQINGEWNLGDGDVLLVPAGEPHRMLEAHGQQSWELGFFVPAFIADGAAALLEPFERVRDGASAVVQIPTARQGFLEILFREIEQVEKKRRESGNALAAVEHSLLTLILAEVDRAMTLREASRDSRRSVVTDALRFIERNCLRPLTLHEVAVAVGRSPAYVTTALTQATGRSAVQWIVSGRMAEARRRLVHSDESVDAVAERIGYADATHFIRMFRREHGVTPAVWRAAQTRRSR
jgi:AraC family transcriptional regulator, transcriptional activator of pobA